MSNSVELRVDAIVTWVNGNDPKYQKKISHYGKIEKLKISEKLLSKYNQIGEITLCIKSILKFAPYIRKIFIVTDQQDPRIEVKEKEKIVLIDHKEIFRGYEDYMPTFNIRTIETAFHRIRDLSEHFIYFNDDMFLIKPTTIHYWFNEEKKAIIRGKWSKLYNKIWYKRLKDFFISKNKRPGYNRAQSKSAEKLGFNEKYYKSFHTARPMIKSISEKYFDQNPHIFINQIKYRFRNNDQFIPYSLNWHLMIKLNKAVLNSDTGNIEIHSIEKKSLKTLKKITNSSEKNESIFSINIQDMNKASIESQKYLINWIDTILKKTDT